MTLTGVAEVIILVNGAVFGVNAKTTTEEEDAIVQYYRMQIKVCNMFVCYDVR